MAHASCMWPAPNGGLDPRSVRRSSRSMTRCQVRCGGRFRIRNRCCCRRDCCLRRRRLKLRLMLPSIPTPALTLTSQHLHRPWHFTTRLSCLLYDLIRPASHPSLPLLLRYTLQKIMRRLRFPDKCSWKQRFIVRAKPRPLSHRHIFKRLV